MIELIDSHCHLDYDYLPKTETDLIREAQSVGVTTLITMGTEIDSIPKVEAISARQPRVFYTVGIHPHQAITMKDGDLALLEAASQNPKCRAIGEIGLDYHYDHSPRDVQHKCLKTQLDLALRVRLPVVIHCREAEEDLLKYLTEYVENSIQSARTTQTTTLPGTVEPSTHIPGVIHCFTGTQSFGEACLKLGFYISFSGVLTFKTADSIRTCAKAFPIERLLVETDAPYLAPVPYRGKKCEPSMVKFTAQKLAEVKALSLEEVARITTQNAKRVFGLDSGS